MEATPIYPRRNLWAAARDALVWLSGPVSERGASRGFRISVHMGGRVLHQRRLAMREHPVGRCLLDERPDLCGALNDMSALGAMPDGSLGRAYQLTVGRATSQRALRQPKCAKPFAPLRITRTTRSSTGG